jgi:hypothetical protein
MGISIEMDEFLFPLKETFGRDHFTFQECSLMLGK